MLWQIYYKNPPLTSAAFLTLQYSNPILCSSETINYLPICLTLLTLSH